jgi:hypothetical protein
MKTATDKERLLNAAEIYRWDVEVIEGWAYGKPGLRITKSNLKSRVYVKLGVNDQITYLSVGARAILRNRREAALSYLQHEMDAIDLHNKYNMGA